MKLSGKIAVVTGGSSGIGFGIAKLFLQEGAKVAIFARTLETLEKANQECNNQLMIFQGDVKQVSDLENFYLEVNNKLGKIDIVVANAGRGLKGFISETSEKDFDEVVAINFKGTFFTVQKSLPYMNNGGSIVTISSMAGNLGISGNGLYGATKAAINHLTTTLAAELLPSRKIRVNTVSPGYTMTPAFERLIATDPTALEKREKNVPLGRVATVEDIAKTVLFLASDDAAYVCGVNLTVDGGVSSVFPNSSYKPQQNLEKQNISIQNMQPLMFQCVDSSVKSAAAAASTTSTNVEEENKDSATSLQR